MSTFTRAEFRELLRRHLADVSGTAGIGIWGDTAIDDALTDALHQYSEHVPREAVCSVTVLRGDEEIPIPSEVDPRRIVRLFDDRGEFLRRSTPSSPPFGGERVWRLWVEKILLGQPASHSGVWRIEHTQARLPPGSDDDALDCPPDDLPILTQFAMAIALRRRAVDDGKRDGAMTFGRGVHPLLRAAQQAEARAHMSLSGRRRAVRGGVLSRI